MMRIGTAIGTLDKVLSRVREISLPLLVVEQHHAEQDEKECDDSANGNQHVFAEGAPGASLLQPVFGTGIGLVD